MMYRNALFAPAMRTVGSLVTKAEMPTVNRSFVYTVVSRKHSGILFLLFVTFFL